MGGTGVARDCEGTHRYFVAECIGIPGEGKAVLLVVCTACGDSFAREFKVSNGVSPLQLKQKEE